MDLAHRVCLVTGASSLVGRAICRRLARQGVHLVATDVAGESAEALVAELGGVAFRSDLREPRDATALVAHVEQRVGPIDLVCWNAPAIEPGGIDLPDAAWRDELNASFLAYLGLTRLVVPDMIRRGQGWLVSVAAWDAWRAPSAPPATLAVIGDAVAALTRWLGDHYGVRGLRTLALAPPALGSPGVPTKQHGERPVHPDGVAALFLAELQRVADATDLHPRTTTEPAPL
ncbi:MAG: SDR family NAD(P)-dependent oxidoreductase [Gemmatimonadales bacterium]|nr:SDR family NAD(P)-dependent oxidoreductase [Gemmatimonadales bacterium]